MGECPGKSARLPPDTVSPTSDDGVPDDTTLTLEQECVPVACGQDIEWAVKYKRSCSQRWDHTWAKRMYLSLLGISILSGHKYPPYPPMSLVNIQPLR